MLISSTFILPLGYILIYGLPFLKDILDIKLWFINIFLSMDILIATTYYMEGTDPANTENNIEPANTENNIEPANTENNIEPTPVSSKKNIDDYYLSVAYSQFENLTPEEKMREWDNLHKKLPRELLNLVPIRKVHENLKYDNEASNDSLAIGVTNILGDWWTTYKVKNEQLHLNIEQDNLDKFFESLDGTVQSPMFDHYIIGA